jgi:hypothetical protein
MNKKKIVEEIITSYSLSVCDIMNLFKNELEEYFKKSAVNIKKLNDYDEIKYRIDDDREYYYGDYENGKDVIKCDIIGSREETDKEYNNRLNKIKLDKKEKEKRELAELEKLAKKYKKELK